MQADLNVAHIVIIGAELHVSLEENEQLENKVSLV